MRRCLALIHWPRPRLQSCLTYQRQPRPAPQQRKRILELSRTMLPRGSSPGAPLGGAPSLSGPLQVLMPSLPWHAMACPMRCCLPCCAFFRQNVPRLVAQDWVSECIGQRWTPVLDSIRKCAVYVPPSISWRAFRVRLTIQAVGICRCSCLEAPGLAP